MIKLPIGDQIGKSATFKAEEITSIFNDPNIKYRVGENFYCHLCKRRVTLWEGSCMDHFKMHYKKDLNKIIKRIKKR